ncbi:MAG: RnfABCDGE type electron transport complex subunit D [Rikenellaceae bacterium]
MKIISPSPHLHSGNSTSRIMRDVAIALLPTLLFSVYLYGLESLYVTGVAVASCMAFEWLINRFLLKRANTLCDYSAIVTGLLLAFNVPPMIPLWIVVLGAFVAIGVAKMSYGGLGRNLFNPALVGRVFLLISFPVQMTTFHVSADALGVDSITGATPLTFVKEALSKGANASEIISGSQLQDILLGFKDGSLGEMAGMMIILGGIFLLLRKVITWHIPVVTILTVGVFATILWLVDPTQYINPLFHIFTGGVLLGSIFMATDYTTSPMSVKGQVVFAIGIGVITMLIRIWGAYPEGISFAILIMNATVPLINNYFKPRRFAK